MEFKTSSGVNHTAERDRRILDHMAICRNIAQQILKRLPGQVELDDLIHAGVLGLMDAADKYDPSKQVEFASYARHRIRGAILDSLRKLDSASRDLRRRWKKMDAVTSELSKSLERNPTEAEVAERLEISVFELRELKFDAQCRTHVSTRYVSPIDDTMVEQDFPSRRETQPDNMFIQVELQAVLNKAMKPLPPRQKQVVMAYYAGEKTMKQIADSLGINESRVSQLHKSALVRMQTALRANGVHSGEAF